MNEQAGPIVLRRGPLQALRPQLAIRPLQLLQLHLGALGCLQRASLQLHQVLSKPECVFEGVRRRAWCEARDNRCM